MPWHKPSRKRLRSLCAEVHADDGSDPRVFFRKDGLASQDQPTKPASSVSRCSKFSTPCSRVNQAMTGLLDLAVVAVEPAPDASRLLVTVAPRPSPDPSRPAGDPRQPRPSFRPAPSRGRLGDHPQASPIAGLSGGRDPLS